MPEWANGACAVISAFFVSLFLYRFACAFMFDAAPWTININIAVRKEEGDAG